MVRVIGFLVGLGFVGVLAYSLIIGAIAFATEEEGGPTAYDYHHHARDVSFPSDGPLGHFDRQQLQRGFQVFREVCAACHSLEYVSFRNLTDLGFTEAEVDAIADQWPIQVPTVDENTGEDTTRSAVAADHFPLVYANEVAGRAANNNAYPPDLSLITKAREEGAAYLYSLLVGYEDPPADLPDELQPGVGLYYNPYFPNLNLAMPPPLFADQLTYADGTEATVEQMAYDVTAFLIWTAEPKMEERKATGWAVLIFLIFLTTLAFLAYKNIWRDQKH
ncbi:MAG: cytochrome c1 [Parasphingopyxis sp.]|uniref:cytochrome c1 n=1 Tax=Parasphingopyxis sp. TaxID=1920299 RepID=UPI003F9FC4DA